MVVLWCCYFLQSPWSNKTKAACKIVVRTGFETELVKHSAKWFQEKQDWFRPNMGECLEYDSILGKNSRLSLSLMSSQQRIIGWHSSGVWGESFKMREFWLNIFTSCNTIAMILNGFNEVLYKLCLQVTVL